MVAGVRDGAGRALRGRNTGCEQLEGQGRCVQGSSSPASGRPRPGGRHPGCPWQHALSARAGEGKYFLHRSLAGVWLRADVHRRSWRGACRSAAHPLVVPPHVQQGQVPALARGQHRQQRQQFQLQRASMHVALAQPPAPGSWPLGRHFLLCCTPLQSAPTDKNYLGFCSAPCSTLHHLLGRDVPPAAPLG